MGQGVGAEPGHGAALLDDDVVGGGETLGHVGAGGVGDAQQQLADLFLGLLLAGHAVGRVGLEEGHAGLGGLCLLLLALLHQGADGGRQLLQLAGGGVVGLLEAPALRVELQDARDGFLGVEALDGQALYDMFGVRFYVCEY